MRRRSLVLACLAASALLIAGGMAQAQEKISFPSAAMSADQPGLRLDGYLFRPSDPDRHPAAVLLHGCGGLLDASGKLMAREADWARHLLEAGYVVLAVDSFAPRGVRNECATGTRPVSPLVDRPRDAYGALVYLRSLSFVRPEAIGLIGWSHGGWTLLYAIQRGGIGERLGFAGTGFAAAVAFYPGSCDVRVDGAGWTPSIPLLVLIGEADVWTPAPSCARVMEHAGARGGDIRTKLYPGAYHDFDWPDLPRRALNAYRAAATGMVPIVGTDEVARADALMRVPAFFTEIFARGAK